MAASSLLGFLLLRATRGAFAPDPSNVMNKGGIPYAISNPSGSTKNWVGQPGHYSTDFNNNVAGPVEHFDVYGEVRTKYSQVYWTRNTPINLPPELVARFHGKVMAITGYEVDQVTHEGPQPGSTTLGDKLGGFACYRNTSCSGTDRSIPIYNAYNHHYFGWLVGKDAEVYRRDEPIHVPNPSSTGIRDLPNDHGFPTNIVFKENPGGEFRKSYHGYPRGYAQLLHSPTQWIVEPMQIDTHNRKFDIHNEVGYVPSFLPTMDHNNMTDLSSGLSPLIECPCTDRITRKVERTSPIMVSDKCKDQITSAEACTQAVNALAKVSVSATISNMSQPAGCFMTPDPSVRGQYMAVFNRAPSVESCGSGGADVALEGQADLGNLVNLSVAHDGKSATISISGPDGVWFGIGFGAQAMKDRPYAIIVDGSGAVSERRLEDHGPGVLLKPSLSLLSSSVISGVRTVKLSRPVAGAGTSYYSIPRIPGRINVITAVGSTPSLAYHRARTGANFVFLTSNARACVCEPKTAHILSYMNESSMEFDGYDCEAEPRSNMLQHGDGTGRPVPNAACHMQTYHGGLQCCQHHFFLTDLGQNDLIPDKVDTYFLKWRYYFQEYIPAASAATASHQHLHHWVFLIDANVNDYEEDNAHYGSRSIGKIEANLLAKDMGLEDQPKTYKGITPLVMTPHCHAPSCIREELWNADTGEIICNATAKYGSPDNGLLKQVFNEANYIAIPPCIFGAQPGLQRPFTLSPSTRLKAVKYFNNTFRHLGQMAQWTGLMIYDTDPYSGVYV